MSDETTDQSQDTGHADPRLDADVVERNGLDRATVEAVGKLSEAFEAAEVARGHLYEFHRLSGRADLQAGEAVDLLREAGHDELADRIDRELVGRNVLFGRWTFQVVEEYDAGYFGVFKAFDEESLGLVGGMRHLYEASMKRDRRSNGEPGHEATPAE